MAKVEIHADRSFVGKLVNSQLDLFIVDLEKLALDFSSVRDSYGYREVYELRFDGEWWLLHRHDPEVTARHEQYLKERPQWKRATGDFEKCLIEAARLGRTMKSNDRKLVFLSRDGLFSLSALDS